MGGEPGEACAELCDLVTECVADDALLSAEECSITCEQLRLNAPNFDAIVGCIGLTTGAECNPEILLTLCLTSM